MEARTPDAAGTELSELDPALIAGRHRVRCLLEHAPRREVTAGIAERAELGTARPRPRHGSGVNLDVSGQPSASRPHPSKGASDSFIRRVRRMERP